MNEITLSKAKDCWRGCFTAMASPCEVLMDVGDEKLAWKILNMVASEASRIEKKFSRYRDDNIIAEINSADGRTIEVDEEVARLIDFSDQLFQMSEGLFDITSGVLRQVWRFDGSDRIPDKDAVKKICDRIGWQKVRWHNNQLQLERDMEIDLGGIGKEYAVDRCIQQVGDLTDQSVLVNFGGDLATSCQRRGGKYWSVGRLITGKDRAVALFQLYKGAIATSGDANRFLLKNGIRYSHVLNPKTGWPIVDAPHTISVAANTCTEAGMFSTLAMLQGSQAKEFLSIQGVEYWID